MHIVFTYLICSIFCLFVYNFKLFNWNDWIKFFDRMRSVLLYWNHVNGITHFFSAIFVLFSNSFNCLVLWFKRGKLYAKSKTVLVLIQKVQSQNCAFDYFWSNNTKTKFNFPFHNFKPTKSIEMHTIFTLF